MAKINSIWNLRILKKQPWFKIDKTGYNQALYKKNSKGAGKFAHGHSFLYAYNIPIKKLNPIK